MLCKTIIGFSSELVRVPNVATANETRNVDGCFFEAPASAKQAGVLHILVFSLSPLSLVASLVTNDQGLLTNDSWLTPLEFGNDGNDRSSIRCGNV
jgi:hypothetical protein